MCILALLALFSDGILAQSPFERDFEPPMHAIAKEPRALVGHSKPIHSIAFSADQKAVAASATDGTIRIWNVETGKLLFHRKENAVSTVLPSRLGTTLFAHFTIWFDHRLQVRDVTNQSLKWDRDFSQTILRQDAHMGLSRDEAIFGFAARRDDTVRLLESETGKIHGKIKVSGPVNAMAFANTTPSVVIAYSGDVKHVIGIWDVVTLERSKVICRVTRDDQPWRMMLSHDDKRLAEYWAEGSLVLRDVASGKETSTRPDVASGFAMAFTSQNELYFSEIGTRSNVLDIWCLNNNKRIARFQCKQEQSIAQVAMSKDASLVGMGLDDGSVLLWRIQDNQ